MNKLSYDELKSDASKPQKERAELVEKRDGTMARVRRHHLKEEKIKEIRKQETAEGRFISPYRQGSAYGSIVTALSLLGENQRHSFAKFWQKLMEVMSDEELRDSKTNKTPWEKFIGREQRSTETGKSPVEKTIQNLIVLQRLGGANPYGYKLGQLGACIDLFGESDSPEVMLRTGIQIGDGPLSDSITPIREFRKKAVGPAKPGYIEAEGVGGALNIDVVIEDAKQSTRAHEGKGSVSLGNAVRG